MKRPTQNNAPNKDERRQRGGAGCRLENLSTPRFCVPFRRLTCFPVTLHPSCSMPYLFHTAADRQEMLAAIGADSVQQIIDQQVPQSVQLQRGLDLPAGLSELALESEMRRLAGLNASAS